MQLDLPAPKYRNAAAHPQLFRTGEAVTFNGHVGTVRGYSPRRKSPCQLRPLPPQSHRRRKAASVRSLVV